MSVETVRGVLRQLLETLEEQVEHPYGPEVSPDDRSQAGQALLSIVGDADQARTAWRLIVADSGGYFPRAAAVALIRASSTNLVPDVEPAEVQ